MVREDDDGGRLLLTPREAAATLAISERKLWDLTHKGGVPSVRIGRSVRYRFKDLAEWIDKHTSTPGNGTDEAPVPNDSLDPRQTSATGGGGQHT